MSFDPNQPGQPLQPAQPVAQPAKKKRPRWLVPAIIGALLFFVGIGIGANSKTADPKTVAAAPSPTVTVTADPGQPEPAPTVTVTAAPAPAKTVTVTKTAKPAPPAAVPAAIQDDGTFLVGTDVAPGTYKSEGGGSCYWARLSDTTGDGIIVNGGFTTHQIVTIKRSDKAFQTSSCGSWSKVS